MSTVKLKNIATLKYGDALASDIRDDTGGYKVFGSNGAVGLHSKPNTRGVTIVIGRKGSYGKVLYSNDPVFVIDTAYSIDSSTTAADLRWLYYALQTLDFEGSSLDTGVPGLSREFAHNSLIPHVSKNEQKDLAEYLDRKTAIIDKMIASKKHIRAYLAELRTTIITELIFGTEHDTASSQDQLYRHLVSQESGTWGEDPSGINDVKCLRVADFDYEHLSHVQPTTVRSITSAHMRTKLLKEKDILIEKSGGGEKTPVGRAVLVNKLQENITYANFVDRLRFRDTIVPEYALYVLYTLYTGGINTKYIKQNTGIQNLDIKHYLMEPVPVPPIEEQQRIVAYAQERFKKLDKLNSLLKKSVSHLEEYRTSLILNTITGKEQIK